MDSTGHNAPNMIRSILFICVCSMIVHKVLPAVFVDWIGVNIIQLSPFDTLSQDDREMESRNLSLRRRA